MKKIIISLEKIAKSLKFISSIFLILMILAIVSPLPIYADNICNVDLKYFGDNDKSIDSCQEWECKKIQYTVDFQPGWENAPFLVKIVTGNNEVRYRRFIDPPHTTQYKDIISNASTKSTISDFIDPIFGSAGNIHTISVVRSPDAYGNGGTVCNSKTFSIIAAPTPTPVDTCDITTSNNLVETQPISIHIKLTGRFNATLHFDNSDIYTWPFTRNSNDLDYTLPAKLSGDHLLDVVMWYRSDPLNLLLPPISVAKCTLPIHVCTTIDLKNNPDSCGPPTPTPTPPPICDENVCHPDPINPVVGCIGSCSNCHWCPGYVTPIPPHGPVANIETLCKSATEGTPGHPELLGKCLECSKTGGIWSAIGCLPTDLGVFINKYLFTFGIGIIGGVAFLYLLYGAFLIMTSAGNPEQVAQAREIITSSLMGLLLAIFSILILRIISVDILRLPGFESNSTPSVSSPTNKPIPTVDPKFL